MLFRAFPPHTIECLRDPANRGKTDHSTSTYSVTAVLNNPRISHPICFWRIELELLDTRSAGVGRRQARLHPQAITSTRVLGMLSKRALTGVAAGLGRPARNPLGLRSCLPPGRHASTAAGMTAVGILDSGKLGLLDDGGVAACRGKRVLVGSPHTYIGRALMVVGEQLGLDMCTEVQGKGDKVVVHACICGCSRSSSTSLTRPRPSLH